MRDLNSIAAGLSPGQAAAVPQLALALWIWDAAGLEPGETAVFTSGSAIDGWLGTVAGWRSLREVIRLDVDGEAWQPRSGIVNLATTEPQEAVGRLSAELRKAPGVVVAISTPAAVAVDVVLESLPMWARIVLTIPSSRPATIDFYGNVHRKGVRILSVPGSSEELVEPSWRELATPQLERAARILKSERLAAQCPA